MTSYPSSPAFSKHTDNLRAITSALTQVERTHKRAIRESDEPSEKAMRIVHTLLLGVYAEARLRKILEDPTGFNARERQLIWLEKSQDKRWLASVDFAARRHYKVMSHQDLSEVAPPQAFDRIETISALLRHDLAPVITDRNRLAHGQWVHQLRSRSEDTFTDTSVSFDYNYVALDARKQLLDFIARIVNVLAVSEPTFDRDFSDLMEKIGRVKASLSGDRYPQFASQLRGTRLNAG
ncbi:hypothetical protein [Zhihengliuella sp. ISTPL4]|uniref:hypothetical protein n=1 Tax=Zhihengliuella sp. ISTPL4 TaxID=2058657 RepID=UPI001305487D|nr:hypothetical protein [Zhihengliuella sp. ISTPL4]